MVVKGAPCTSCSGGGGGDGSGASDPPNPDRLESFRDDSLRPPMSSGSQEGLAVCTASRMTVHTHTATIASRLAEQRPPRLPVALLRGTEAGSSRSECELSPWKRARLTAKVVAICAARSSAKTSLWVGEAGSQPPVRSSCMCSSEGSVCRAVPANHRHRRGAPRAPGLSPLHLHLSAGSRASSLYPTPPPRFPRFWRGDSNVPLFWSDKPPGELGGFAVEVGYTNWCT